MTEAERIWRENSDEALLEAAAGLDSYTEEGRHVIRAELRRRGYEDPREQAMSTGAEAGADAGDAGDVGPERLRCELRLRCIGKRSVLGGAHRDAGGESGDPAERAEAFHAFVCPSCGHIDLFIDFGDG